MQTHRAFKVLIIGLAVSIGAAQPVARALAPTPVPATKPTTKPATKPTTAPTSRPASRAKQVDPLRVAILELQGEAQTALQKRGPFPRSASDYFKPGNPIDSAALLKVLGSRINQNPRVDAYVKFQLLSAVETFDGDLALPALKAYVLGSPPMIALPGITQQEQQKWTQKATTARQDDVAGINDEWRATLAPFVEANAIIISYRDLMKSKIDTTEATKHKYFQACLEDLSQRGAAGFDVDTPLNALTKSIMTWGHLARREQIKDMIAAMKEYTLRKPVRMYDELSWKSSDKEAVWKWHYAGLSVSRIEKTQEELETALKNAIE